MHKIVFGPHFGRFFRKLNRSPCFGDNSNDFFPRETQKWRKNGNNGPQFGVEQGVQIRQIFVDLNIFYVGQFFLITDNFLNYFYLTVNALTKRGRATSGANPTTLQLQRQRCCT
jgi:hypothetical protein